MRISADIFFTLYMIGAGTSSANARHANHANGENNPSSCNQEYGESPFSYISTFRGHAELYDTFIT